MKDTKEEEAYMAPCISVNSLNCILKAIGSQCNRCSAAVMLCWSRRRKPRTTLAAARWTISGRMPESRLT